jgi:hypothetical protein
MAKLRLLPVPKSVRERKGVFQLDESVPLLLGPGSDTDVYAAWSFAGEIEDRCGFRPPIERQGKLDGIPRRVLFLVPGRDDKLYAGLRKLAEPLKKAPDTVRDQAYVLRVDTDEVVAAATTPQGLFYAAQTLRQLLSTKSTLPCITIADWPTYPYRGVMLDISRYRVPTLDSLFDRIERLAALKINVFQLYTEHTFSFRRHPLVGKDCGSMTADDIIELDEFCKQSFIDLNANFQSFGHHAEMLALPEYNDLAELPDQPWTLNPTDKRTYALLDDLYSEVLPAYSSHLFNASCDETWELGTGRSKKKADKVGVGRVYLEHIKKINDLARKYGKRLMIWADIILKHPELVSDVPKDIVMLDWSYNKIDKLTGLQKIADCGLEHWSCPGINSWSRIFCDFDNACGNIARRAVAGQKSGATGLLNTDWGDNGHCQPPAVSYHGYAYGAEQAWTPNEKPQDADFDKRFAWAWFGDDSGAFGDLYRETGLLNKDTMYKPLARPWHLYWAPFPLQPDLLEKAPDAEMRRRAGNAIRAFEIIQALTEAYPEHRATLREMLFGVAQMLLVEKKVRASRELDELKAEGNKKLPAKLKKMVRELRDEWDVQHAEFEDLWLQTSRRSQIAYRLGEYKKRARDYRKKPFKQGREGRR